LKVAPDPFPHGQTNGLRRRTKAVEAPPTLSFWPRPHALPHASSRHSCGKSHFLLENKTWVHLVTFCNSTYHFLNCYLSFNLDPMQRAHLMFHLFFACTASGDVDAFELLKEDLKDDEENVIATINRLLTVGMLFSLFPFCVSPGSPII
jgi:hypothetical protein